MSTTTTKNRLLESWQTAKEKLFQQPTTTATATDNDSEKSENQEFGGESSSSSISDFEARLEQLLPPTNGANQEGRYNKKILNEEEESYTQLDHCRQLETWDCGVACLLMIFRWLRSSPSSSAIITYPENSTLLQHECEERDSILKRIGATSIWTAELVLELHEFMLPNTHTNAASNYQHYPYIFCSKTLQVEMEHQDVGYYQSEFGNDYKRVNGVFQTLQDMRASMMCLLPELPLQNVLRAVSHPECVAIVLVDNSILTAGSNNQNNTGNDDRYQGHYVILCGTSRRKEHLELATRDFKSSGGIYAADLDYCFVLCNPSQYTPWMYVTPDQFERSWRSKGTDDDIIFVVRR